MRGSYSPHFIFRNPQGPSCLALGERYCPANDLSNRKVFRVRITLLKFAFLKWAQPMNAGDISLRPGHREWLESVAGLRNDG